MTGAGTGASAPSFPWPPSSLWDPVSAPILGGEEGPQQGEATRWQGQAGSQRDEGRGSEEPSPLASEGVYGRASQTKTAAEMCFLEPTRKGNH